jgi:hypothetical protein
MPWYKAYPKKPDQTQICFSEPMTAFPTNIGLTGKLTAPNSQDGFSKSKNTSKSYCQGLEIASA